MTQYGKSIKNHEFLVNNLKILLVNNKVLLNFTKYVRDRHGTSIDEYLNSVRNTPKNFIFRAFGWHNTIEGDDFWLDMHDKWKDNLNKEFSKKSAIKCNSIW